VKSAAPGIRRKAIHEAGHVVAAWRRGIGVRAAKIGTTLDPEAETDLDLPDEMSAEHDHELLDGLAETYFAARAAAICILGEPDPEFTYEGDLHQVSEIANELGLRSGERDQWFRTRQEAAMATAERDRDLIQAVAAELIDRRYLSQAEVTELLPLD
jgi:hypothetical protein